MARGKAKFSGKDRPAQFGKTSAGARETGFKQWSPKAVTAAMQGKPMQTPATKAKPKNNGTKQFGKAPGKAVF